jgi:hypothetical protein
MADLVVKCGRCGNDLTHVCDNGSGKLREAVIELMSWTPHFGMSPAVIKEGKKSGMYQKGDEEAPFISEAYLYTLLGKDDARTFMAMINHLLRLVGFDPHGNGIDQSVNDILAGREERKRLAAQRQKVYLENRKKREAEAKKAKKKGK